MCPQKLFSNELDLQRLSITLVCGVASSNVCISVSREKCITRITIPASSRSDVTVLRFTSPDKQTNRHTLAASRLVLNQTVSY
jgi:hypothetical protein